MSTAKGETTMNPKTQLNSQGVDEMTARVAELNRMYTAIRKEREDLEIALSLRSIARGGAPIDPFIAKRILALVAKTPATAPTPSAPMPIEVPPEAQLSQREQEVLRMVAQGLSNREIANAMSLSHLTVESHTKNIYRKLAVGSRTEAVYRARHLGWLQ